jgi:hypothetical protein
MFLGISLSLPGMAVLYVYAGNQLFSNLLPGVMRIDKFTPYNLVSMSDAIAVNHLNGVGLYEGTGAANILATVAVAVILSLVFMLLTLFAVTAKRMDNTLNEVY